MTRPARVFGQSPLSGLTPTRLRRLLAVLAVTALAIAIAGCGTKKEVVNPAKQQQDRLSLLLDWTPNADHAGIYTGLAKHRFAQEGLYLKINSPSDAATVIPLVQSGRADIGISYESDVMSAIDKGAKVKAVAAIVPTPLNSLMWLKSSKIKNVKDLKGKTVGYSGAYGEAYLNTLLKLNGVDPKSVKKIDLNYNLNPALVSGKVDATITGYWNVEAVQLAQKGKPVTAIPVDKLGVPKYDELVLITSDSNLNDSDMAGRIRRFIAALQQGTQDAVNDPRLAIVSVAAADKADSKNFIAASVKKTLPVLLDRRHAYGYLVPEEWASYANWMRDNGMLTKPANASAAYTNALLPSNPPPR